MATRLRQLHDVHDGRSAGAAFVVLCLAGYVLWYVRKKLTERPEPGAGESHTMYMSKRSGSSFGGIHASDLHLSTGGGSDGGLAVPVATSRSWGANSGQNRCTPLLTSICLRGAIPCRLGTHIVHVEQDGPPTARQHGASALPDVHAHSAVVRWIARSWKRMQPPCGLVACAWLRHYRFRVAQPSRSPI